MSRNSPSGQIVNAPVRLSPRRTPNPHRTVRANVAQARPTTESALPSLPSQTPVPPLQQLLTRQEAAAMLRLSEKTLRNWASARVGPPWLKIGRTVRYRPDDLALWLDESRSQAGA